MRRIVALVVGLGLALSACVSEPEVVEVTRDVIITETGESQPACDELLDAIQLIRARSRLALGPNVGPADGVSDQLLRQAIDLLGSNGVQNDVVLFERLDAAVTAALEPCLNKGTVDPPVKS